MTSMDEATTAMGRDRLRELLDATLAEDHDDLAAMARGAHVSAFHFSRQLRGATHEAPVSLRRRVLLERAAWQLRRGRSVTETAWDAGYDSVEGFRRAFARAYGASPSTHAGEGTGHWLPSPNGIHFHPPSSLWVEAGGAGGRAAEVLGRQVLHDVEDTAAVLERCAGLRRDELDRVLSPGHTVLEWSGPEESLGAVLRAMVETREAWVAALRGQDRPPAALDRDGEVPALLERHRRAADEWVGLVREVELRDAWDDVVVDALCDPPESFEIGSIVHHVLHLSSHRRMLARALLRRLGHDVDDGDPILWQRSRSLDPDGDGGRTTKGGAAR